MRINHNEIKDEIWKPLSINKKYAVSNLGRVASVAMRGSISVLSPFDNGKGYKVIRLRKPKPINQYVHRLVAEAFCKNPDNKKEVNHIDGNKGNNRASNLSWVTLQENRDHSKISGLTLCGEEHSQSKLTDDKVLEILELLHNNPNANKSAIGRQYGVGWHAIKKIADGKGWKHIKRVSDPIFRTSKDQTI